MSTLAISAHSSALAIRRAARAGSLTGHTSGLARDYVQANLAILPASHADDFRSFCEINARACPLLAVTEPGATAAPSLGVDLDVSRDAPRYRVWRNGELADEPADVSGWWRDDLVTFVIGCSFSFEHALLAEGVPLRHVEQGRNVAMYRSAIPTRGVGLFHGPTVVSMRPLRASDAIRAVQITSRMPMVHGAPLHLGDPSLIGIHDLSRPDYGDPVEVMADELPVFWACGVTPQAAIANARLPLCITHAPGSMLVTDLLNRDLLTH